MLAQIGGMTIYGTPDSWTFDDHILRDNLNLFHRLQMPPTVYYSYNDPECADAAELYYAAQEEAQEAEEHAAILDVSSDGLVQFTCKPVDAQKKLCLDFFITSSRAGVLLQGDNRTFDPEAGWADSRVQLYVDPQTRQWEVKYNSTRVVLCGTPVMCATITRDDSVNTFNPSEDVKIRQLADTLEIEVQLFNNFCVIRTGCPAINGTYKLIPDASKPSGWRVGWVRDGFPAVGIYQRNAANTGWLTVAEDPEKIKNSVIAWTALAGRWAQSIQMPEYCNMS